jgi:hypothetical protein
VGGARGRHHLRPPQAPHRLSSRALPPPGSSRRPWVRTSAT